MKTYAYAWFIKADDDPFGPWTLCCWAAASADRLKLDEKPSPEALCVRVEMTPTSKAVRRKLKPANPTKKKVSEYRRYQQRAGIPGR